jgi:hypothetical protein
MNKNDTDDPRVAAGTVEMTTPCNDQAYYCVSTRISFSSATVLLRRLLAVRVQDSFEPRAVTFD